MSGDKGREPAFPTTPVGEQVGGLSGGISVRLYVATAALQGLLAGETEGWNFKNDYALAAEQACKYADALIEQESRTLTPEPKNGGK